MVLFIMLYKVVLTLVCESNPCVGPFVWKLLISTFTLYFHVEGKSTTINHIFLEGGF